MNGNGNTPPLPSDVEESSFPILPAALSEEKISTSSSISPRDAPDSPTEQKIKSRTLLEEVEENLAQSLLVFLIADLRLMSATGRIETKYETIAIASDPPSRSTSQELAGMKGSLPKNHISETLVKNMEEGLSPAQIMAVLIIELKKTVEARREEEERQRAEGGVFQNKRDEGAFKDDKLYYFEPDKKTGGMRLNANEEDMHSLLRAYADMIGEDLKSDVPHIARRASTLYITPSMEHTSTTRQMEPKLSSVQEGEGDEEESSAATESVENGESNLVENEKPDVPLENFSQRVEHVRQEVGQQLGKMAADAQQRTDALRQRTDALRQSLMTGPLYADQETRTNAEFGEVTDALFKQGASSGNLRVSDSSERTGQSLPQNFTQEELLEFMEKAVESRVYGNLDFLADFFRDGTVSKLMAESNARVVWMNDWYPLKVS